MRCPYCGSEVIEAKFCTNCGAPLAGLDAHAAEAAGATAAHAAGAAGAAVAAGVAGAASAAAGQTTAQQPPVQPYQPVQEPYQQPYQPAQQPYEPYQQAYEPPTSPYADTQYNASYGDKSKIAAGVLAILLGGLGIHKFYLGYTTAGLIMLLVTILSLGMAAPIVGIIGLVEGIIYLTKTDADFYNTYVLGDRAWF